MSSMQIVIGLVCKRLADRLWLASLREWATHAPLPRTLQVAVSVSPMANLDDALTWSGENPDARVVCAIGFSRAEVACLHASTPLRAPLIVGPLGEPQTEECASATFLDHRPLIYCSDPMASLRKCLLRMALRDRLTIRSPESDRELAGYFSLRYTVWEKSGFLREENRKSSCRWEVDYSDRTSIPLVAYSNEGAPIGCTRLVRALGREEDGYSRRIETLIGQSGDQKLADLFEYPHQLVQPFDVLHVFPAFRHTFRNLLIRNVEMAEIGRVAVLPEYRNQGIAEVLVDTAVSIAINKSVSRLFLACDERKAALYSKCGFVPVAGVKSDTFFNIRVPSIVMERLALAPKEKSVAV